MSIGIIIIAAIGALAGIVTTLYLTLSMPAVIIWKFYRRIVHGIPIMK